MLAVKPSWCEVAPILAAAGAAKGAAADSVALRAPKQR